MTEGRVKPARWARYSRPLPPRGLTVYQTLQAIRQMGLTASCSQGEFRLNYRHGIEAQAYYTNDKQDALDTAILMAAPTRQGC